MQDFKKKIEAFKNLESKTQVAEILQTSWKRMSFILYGLAEHYKYQEFHIVKRNGTHRTISSPCKALKFYQRQLNTLLQQTYSPRPFVNGFCNEKSIIDNARPHVNKRFVLNIDIESFFDAINFGRVRGLFQSLPFKFNQEVSTVLAQIVCHKNKLPQGSPTSPVLSNLICWRLDNELFSLAKHNTLTYTRYADDISFSTHLKKFPTRIASSSAYNKVKLGEELIQVFQSNGFKINNDKVRLQEKHHKQEVTGLIVNKFPNTNRKYIRNTRSMLHAWKKFGLKSASEEFLKKSGRPHIKTPEIHFANVIKGKLEFIGCVKGKDNSTYLNLLGKAVSLQPNFFKVENALCGLLKRYSQLWKLKSSAKKITPQERGICLEKLTNDVFNYFKIPVISSFKRNEGAEQIDGAFQFNGWFYLTEMKWQAKPISSADLASLSGKVSRSGKQTLGFCISINGWSKYVVPTLKQNPVKDIILMDGKELHHVLSGRISLTKLIELKIEALNLTAEPFHNIVSHTLKQD